MLVCLASLRARSHYDENNGDDDNEVMFSQSHYDKVDEEEVVER